MFYFCFFPAFGLYFTLNSAVFVDGGAIIIFDPSRRYPSQYHSHPNTAGGGGANFF